MADHTDDQLNPSFPHFVSDLLLVPSEVSLKCPPLNIFIQKKYLETSNWLTESVSRVLVLDIKYPEFESWIVQRL